MGLKCSDRSCWVLVGVKCDVLAIPWCGCKAVNPVERSAGQRFAVESAGVSSKRVKVGGVVDSVGRVHQVDGLINNLWIDERAI